MPLFSLTFSAVRDNVWCRMSKFCENATANKTTGEQSGKSRLFYYTEKRLKKIWRILQIDAKRFFERLA
jgi:hypothetical protein